MEPPFDKIASNYDKTFTDSIIGKLQRNIIWNYLEKIFRQRTIKNVLELNCGTGEDALFLAKKGCRITATDSSEKMLEITKRKSTHQNFHQNIEIKKLDINADNDFILDKKFDLIFSNFGGINCIAPKRLNELNALFASLLTRDGRLVLVLMPRYCLLESLYFLIKLKPVKIFRRSSNTSLNVNIGGSIVETFYYSRKELRNIFSDKFKTVKTIPVGFFIPPAYLNSFISNRHRLVKLLNNLERSAVKIPSLSDFSDHFLIDMVLNK